MRVGKPSTSTTLVANGKVNRPAPVTTSCVARTPILTVTREVTEYVSWMKALYSLAEVGGSEGPIRARVTRNRLALS
jgi:hypothetical protein